MTSVLLFNAPQHPPSIPRECRKQHRHLPLPCILGSFQVVQMSGEKDSREDKEQGDTGYCGSQEQHQCLRSVVTEL
jgi:hypothetical protein